jgi:hypothetical protein
MSFCPTMAEKGKEMGIGDDLLTKREKSSSKAQARHFILKMLLFRLGFY